MTENKNIRKSAALIPAAFLCAYSLTWLFPLEDNRLILNNSVLSIVISVAFYFLLKLCFSKLNKRSFICSSIIGFVFSCMLTVGAQLGTADTLTFDKVGPYVGILGGTILFTALVNGFLTNFNGELNEIQKGGKLNFLFDGSKKQFFIVWGVIFVCWIPCLLAVFPGIYAYDGIAQLWQASHESITAHHPVLHTYFIHFCFEAGNKIFGNYDAGMAVYSVVQMLAFSATLSYACRKLSLRGIPKIVQIVALLLFTLNPMLPIMAVSSTKDILFGCAVILFSMSVWDIAICPRDFFHSPLRLIQFYLWSVFLFTSKNNGFYIFLITIPFIIIASKTFRVKAFLLCVAVAASYLLYTGPIYKALGVERGNDIREALSIPLQQMARAVNKNGDDMSAEEKNEVFKYIPEKAVNSYQPHIADYVKNKFIKSEVKENVPDFIRLYFKLGAKYPKAYAEAFLSNSLGFWYPDADYQSETAIYKFWYMEFENKTQYEAESIYVNRNSLIPKLEEFYENVAMGQTINKIPVLSMLTVSCGFPAWVMLLCASYIVYKKRYRFLLPLCPPFALWVILLMSPAVIYRYALPLIIAIPLMVAFTFDKK